MRDSAALPDSAAVDAPGLERSCSDDSPDWVRQRATAPGVALLQAWFQGRAYRRHRHDTYAIGVTDTGVQAFWYRGATHISMPGEVVVLHPDELHDGYAGSEMGFGYRIVYLEPALVAAASYDLSGRWGTLPFVGQPVLDDPGLVAAVRGAFRSGLEPLAADDLILRITTSLHAADSSRHAARPLRFVDVPAVLRVRAFLDAERSRLIRSEELEAVSGLTRFDLARQFRAMFGTSPYRYSLLRRLDAARDQLGGTQPLVDIALSTGFADQAHFTRMFTAAFGISPGRYRALGR
jgi:AraC-like DNA-binding protein